MQMLSFGLAGIAALLLCACSSGGGAMQQAQAPLPNDSSCDAFARSGGYPFLSGGRMGGNPNLLQLPGAPPLMHGPMETDLQRRFSEEDYLRRWCLENPDRF